ncbi:hypothetical protein FY145_07060 [Agrobacterium tumefaciens]|uniref:Uncharacterized protein n=1 Tax=Agrobacterium tumefaciens TaxID=358 RepID=A0AAP9E3Z0_AGRTU|nr:hypothetical protein [Agrobacterium tumefaciens]NSZ57789.1 hypothetical protein [Agrobacterium tumefaciens]QDY93907.1 hypothetical protein CG010_007055 [Agrobacterium tumefaciens]UXS48980.1 hypothetical protein FY149_17180 [Agrobacterium tumefaciens]UXS70284.1 hypothetical protein FY146_07060 [Agrobacterium tumefaciens]UXS77946.1 hypothetical protein FY145_07060 [Agrobacterium tumefaciens]
MKLFLVIYAGSHIGGVAGPLPYGVDECERRRDQFRSSQAEVIETGFSKEKARALTEEEIAGIKAMRFECEWREFRPRLGPAA